jgi:hypothetical protein
MRKIKHYLVELLQWSILALAYVVFIGLMTLLARFTWWIISITWNIWG